MIIEKERVEQNIEKYLKLNPTKNISKFIMLIHHKCVGLNIFDLYEGEKMNEAVLDFLTLREHIVKAENNEVLVQLSLKSENIEAKKFLEPLGLSIYEAKNIFDKLFEEDFLIVEFNT
jgi:ferredoxin-fold anticodon binding domain-containing protein